MPEDAFEQQHAKSLAIYRKEKEAWMKERADSRRQVAERDARIELLEKTSKFRLITLDTLVLDPVFSVKQDNTLRYVNAAYVTATGFQESDLVGGPVTEFVRGLEFLAQLHDHPELIAAESAHSLKEIPIALQVKEGEEKLMSADVGLTPGEVEGYHGVTVICKPKEDIKWYQRVGDYLFSSWFNRWEIFHGRDYAVDGVIPYSERDSSSKGKHFLQDVTKAVIRQTRRGVIVKFEDVRSCDPKVYELLGTIAKVREGPFTCFVDADSEILNRLTSAGFPKNHLKIIKKKNKK